MLPNKKWEVGRKQHVVKAEGIPQDGSPALQPSLASEDNDMHLGLWPLELSGAILCGDVCFPPHPKLLDTLRLSSPKKAQGGDQNEPGAARVEHMLKSWNNSFPKVPLASLSLFSHTQKPSPSATPYTESKRQTWNPAGYTMVLNSNAHTGDSVVC